MQNQWRDADSVALQKITEREITIEALRLQLEEEKENRERFLASQVELQSDLELENRYENCWRRPREKRLRKIYWPNAHNSKNN